MGAFSKIRVPAAVSSVGRSLRHRNYRLFFSGQIVSLTGTWLSMVATSWLVYRLSRDLSGGKAAFMLGLVGFVGQLPVFLVTPFAGVWVDRWNRHHILLITQALSMLQSFALAFLCFRGIITIPQIFVLSAFQGLLNAFDLPTRQAFVVEMVEDRNDLSNAIALNSSMVHTARLLGPAAAGFLIYQVGEAYCFFIDGISYLAVLIALLYVKVKPRSLGVPKSVLRDLKEGWAYAFGFTPIRALLLLTATVSLLYSSQSVLMPIMADKVLHGNERTLGFLLGTSGLGALMGSLYLASRKSVMGLGRVIRNAVLALGTSLILLSVSRVPALSMVILVVTGAGTVLSMASCNTLLQTIVDDDKRGRVMSLFSLAFIGMFPFGALLCGTVAARIGAPETFALCGCVALVSAFMFGRKLPELRVHIHPILRRKGILPDPEALPT